MKKAFCLILLFVFGCGVLHAQTFFLTNQSDSAYNGGSVFIDDTINHRYIFFTHHTTYSTIDEIRTHAIDYNLNTIAQTYEYYGYDTSTMEKDAFQLSGNEYIMMGLKKTSASTSNHSDIEIKKINASLNTTWKRTIVLPPPFTCIRAKAILTNKNTILIGGNQVDKNDPAQWEKIFLYELTLNGDSIRYNTYIDSGSLFSITYNVIQKKSDSTYLIVNGVSSSYDSALYHIDTNLNFIKKTGIVKPTSGFCGSTGVSRLYSLGNGTFLESRRECYFTKLRHLVFRHKEDGTYLNYKRMPDGTDTAGNIGQLPAYIDPLCKTKNNTVYALEQTKRSISFEIDPNQIEVTKMDTALNIKWSRCLGGDADYRAWSIYPTYDNGCMVLCTKTIHSGSSYTSELYIFKLDTAGTLTGIRNISRPHSLNFTCLPNPATNILTLQIENTLHGSTFNVYTLQGLLVKQATLNAIKNQIDISALAHGNYIYTLLSPHGELASGKFTKE